MTWQSASKIFSSEGMGQNNQHVNKIKLWVLKWWRTIFWFGHAQKIRFMNPAYAARRVWNCEKACNSFRTCRVGEGAYILNLTTMWLMGHNCSVFQPESEEKQQALKFLQTIHGLKVILTSSEIYWSLIGCTVKKLLQTGFKSLNSRPKDISGRARNWWAWKRRDQGLHLVGGSLKLTASTVSTNVCLYISSVWSVAICQSNDNLKSGS